MSKSFVTFSLVTFLLFLHVGCGKDQDSNKVSQESEKVVVDPIEAATDGLQINFKNSYALTQNSSGNTNHPEITAIRVCPLPVDMMASLGSSNPLTSLKAFADFVKILYTVYNYGLCYSFTETIPYGESKKFHIPAEKLNPIYKNGNGTIFFLFNDSIQTTILPSPCWEMPHTIQANTQSKQVFNLEVSGAYSLSYSCKNQKLK